MGEKNNEWSESVEAVVEIAEYVSQAAFARKQRALQQEYTFVQRVVPNIVPLFTKLENTIFETFFSKLFGEKKILPRLENWVSVPIKQGGTVIPKPEEMTDLNYQASTCECSLLLDSLKNRGMFDSASHTNTTTGVRARIKEEKVVINFRRTEK